MRLSLEPFTARQYRLRWPSSWPSTLPHDPVKFCTLGQGRRGFPNFCGRPRRIARPGKKARATMVMTVARITWQNVGKVTEPGRYMFKFGWVTVTPEDLAIWAQYPDATFALSEKP